MIDLLAVTRVTLSNGPLWVRVPLSVHVAAGMVGTITGFTALFARKGAPLHRRAGVAFVYAMIAMGLLGAGVATYEGNLSSVSGGFMAAYFVITAMTTVRPRTPVVDRVDVSAAVIAMLFSAMMAGLAVNWLAHGLVLINGAPLPIVGLLIASIAIASARSDLRMVRAGGYRGARRIRRHLWRMSFSLFIASGSFFLGQVRVIPKPLRIYPLLFTLAFLPLAAMVYWLWRVRGRRPMRRLILAEA